jgi:hypothetical protein
VSLHHLLGSVIRSTFLDVVGKHQAKNPVPKAFLLTFRIPNKPEEEGFRDLEVLLYAPMNYVGVYMRETWNVIPEADLLDDDGGPKPGKKYNEGQSEWTKIAYHDSGWIEGVEKILRLRELLTWGFSQQNKWYRIVDAADYLLDDLAM